VRKGTAESMSLRGLRAGPCLTLPGRGEVGRLSPKGKPAPLRIATLNGGEPPLGFASPPDSAPLAGPLSR
jgi:hypothetical protein